MSTNISDNKAYRYLWLKLALVFCLIAALWHVSSHDFDIASSSTDDCQVCRLNHASAADLTTSIITGPFLIPACIISPYVVLNPTQNPRFKAGARAPPVS